MKQCEVDGCVGKVSARSLCGKHYYRLRKYGDVSTTSRTPHGVRGLRDADGRKQCSSCEQWLDLSKFGKHPETVDKLEGICHPCVAARWRFRRYGVDQSWFDSVLARQGGVCAICKIVDVSDPRLACVDHDHSCCPDGSGCGLCARGVLCRKCNLMLGHALDSIDTLESAVSYLRSFSSLNPS